jgi:hypothetical protein
MANPGSPFSHKKIKVFSKMVSKSVSVRNVTIVLPLSNSFAQVLPVAPPGDHFWVKNIFD